MSVLVVSDGKPVIDNPYLSIVINRNDLGHSFDLGVNKQNQNLVITGENFPVLDVVIPLVRQVPPPPMLASLGPALTTRDLTDTWLLSSPSRHTNLATPEMLSIKCYGIKSCDKFTEVREA